MLFATNTTFTLVTRNRLRSTEYEGTVTVLALVHIHRLTTEE